MPSARIRCHPGRASVRLPTSGSSFRTRSSRNCWPTILAAARRCACPRKLPKVPACHDPHGWLFLEPTIIGKANDLVTDDAELLGLASDLVRLIVAPAAFLDLLRKR